MAKSLSILASLCLTLPGCAAAAAADLTNGDDAVAAVLARYPELSSYRTMTLPPHSIEAAEERPGTWLVAFVRSGSGVDSILDAHCFRVRSGGWLQQTGSFKRTDEATVRQLDFATCQPHAQTAAGQSGWSILGHIRFAAFTGNGSDYRLMMACDGGDMVRLFYELPADTPIRTTQIILRSGDISAALPAQWREVKATPPPVSDPSSSDGEVIGIELAASADLQSPVMEHFLRTGRLIVETPPHRTEANANPRELTALRRLLQTCA
jgi:hypothetical protein